jgi:hypothetical protein
MKMSHLYFDKYCTRTVQFEKSPGAFTFDGEAVPRQYLQDPQKQNILKQSLLRNHSLSYESQLINKTHPLKAIKSRASNAQKPKALHPDEIAELRAQEVATLKHIYHDNNFVREQAGKRSMVTVGNRTWLPAEKILRSTEASHSLVITTPAPPNHVRLGLTPLRMHGSGGQDKPHHVPVSHNVARMKLR